MDYSKIHNMKTDYEVAEIVDDSSDEEIVMLPKTHNPNKPVKPIKSFESELNPIESVTAPKPKRVISKPSPLKSCYDDKENIIEIGVDEAGRGPLFGRVYAAAVIIPKDGSFDTTMVKDSKKYHSKKKIDEAAEYVKTHAAAWSVAYADEKKIDEINILQATQLCMHNAIQDAMTKYNKSMEESAKIEKTDKKDFKYSLLIDGNYFIPMTTFNKEINRIETIPYLTVEGGDNKYASIAAASILAKVARDNYIECLCTEYPELSEHYGIDSNKGYGAKRHLDGIKEHGITIWHRRSFAPCKNYV